MPDSRDSASQRARRMLWRDDDVEIHDLDPALDLGVFADDDLGAFAPATGKEEAPPPPRRVKDVVPPLPDVVSDNDIAVPSQPRVVVKFPRVDANVETQESAAPAGSDPPPAFAQNSFETEATRQSRTPELLPGDTTGPFRGYRPIVAAGLIGLLAIAGGAYFWSRHEAPPHATPASVTASRGTAPPNSDGPPASAAPSQGAGARAPGASARTPLASAPAGRTAPSNPRASGGGSSRTAPRPTSSASASGRSPAQSNQSATRSGDHAVATAGRGSVASSSRAAPVASAPPPRPAPPPRDASGAIAGWLRINAASELQLTVDGVAMGSSRQAPLLLAAGTHTVELASDRAGVRTSTRVTIAPGQVAVVPITLPEGTLSVTAQPDADVFVDGQPAGRTPVDHIALTVGVRKILVRHPELGERSFEVVVREGRQTQLSVDLRPR